MMPLVELGELRLLHKNSGIQLKIATSINVRPCQPNSTLPHENLLDYFRTSLAWFSCYDCFVLEFHLQIEECALCFNTEEARVFEFVAESIVTADLWKQLELKPVLESVTSVNSPWTFKSRIITISLHPCYSNSSATRQLPHRLSQNAAYIRVTPDDVIPTFYFDRVKIILDVFKLSSSSPDEEQPPASAVSLHSCAMVPPSAKTLNFVGEMDVVDYESAFLGPQQEDLVQLRACDSSHNAKEMVEPSAQVELLVALVDAGLRGPVTSKLRLKPGFKMLSDDRRETLARLAPAFWSPGYLNVISETALQVPILSYTLALRLPAKARSPVLRAKLDSLLDHNRLSETLEDNIPGPDHLNPLGTSRNLYLVAYRQIWRAMIAGVAVEKPSSLLKPLKFHRTNHVSSIDLDDRVGKFEIDVPYTEFESEIESHDPPRSHQQSRRYSEHTKFCQGVLLAESSSNNWSNCSPVPNNLHLDTDLWSSSDMELDHSNMANFDMASVDLSLEDTSLVVSGLRHAYSFDNSGDEEDSWLSYLCESQEVSRQEILMSWPHNSLAHQRETPHNFDECDGWSDCESGNLSDL